MAGLFLNRSRQAPAEETPAFGGVAERFRRAGDLDRAITLCREGLKKFPTLLSARVTLGWALLDKGQYDMARVELEQVLRRAPDNLAAIRGLAELHERAESGLSSLDDNQVNWHQQEEDHINIDALLTQVDGPIVAVPARPTASMPVVAPELTNSAGASFLPAAEIAPVSQVEFVAPAQPTVAAEMPPPVLVDAMSSPGVAETPLVVFSVDEPESIAFQEPESEPFAPPALAANDTDLDPLLEPVQAMDHEAPASVLALPPGGEVSLDDLAAAFAAGPALSVDDTPESTSADGFLFGHVVEAFDQTAEMPLMAEPLTENAPSTPASMFSALPAQLEDEDPPTLEIMASSLLDLHDAAIESPDWPVVAVEAPLPDVAAVEEPAPAFAAFDSSHFDVAGTVVSITRVPLQQSRVAALEKFLRKVQARRVQLAAGSVA